MTHYQRKNRTGTTDERSYQADKPCAVDYCTKTAKTRGYCANHYGALYRYGDPYVIKRTDNVSDYPCCLVGCHHPQRARGLCHKHYFHAFYQIRNAIVGDTSEYIQHRNQQATSGQEEVSS